jgi:hypothetical protein
MMIGALLANPETRRGENIGKSHIRREKGHGALPKDLPALLLEI